MRFVDCRACAGRATPRCARGHENPVPGERPSRMARLVRRTSPSASARRRPSAMPGDPSDRARHRDTNRAFGPTRKNTKATAPQVYWTFCVEGGRVFAGYGMAEK